MTAILNWLLSRRRMTLTSVGLFSILGAVAWFQMPRQEDPILRNYWGNVIALFPGSDAETVERLLLKPIEEHLAEVEDIKEWFATITQEQVVIHVELLNAVKDVDRSWDKVRDALDKAALDFPQGAYKPTLDNELNKQDSIVLALTGSEDPLVLRHVAKEIKRELLLLPEVSHVNLVADPNEDLVIALDDAVARRLGIDPRFLAAQLEARNPNLSGGAIKLAERSLAVKPDTEFSSLDEIRNTLVTLPSGASLPLEQIASVRLGPGEPQRSAMRFNGARAIGLGIVPKEGVHLTRFGNEVKLLAKALDARYAPLKLDFFSFQPDYVQKGLSDLGGSLISGIAIVALILLVFMGLRLGLVVSTVIPLVTFSSLAIFAMAGGVLHQISIAALVIALGMLVDNAIVVAENVQWRMDRGELPHQAAIGAVLELSAPLGSATATTLAAFVPMALAKGPTAEFTITIPIVIMLTLTVSYFFAVLVTPILSEILLKPKAKISNSKLSRIPKRVVAFSLQRPWLVLGAASLLVLFSIFGTGRIKQQFFPDSDRNQLVMEIRMTEGTHISETDAAARKIERMLEADPRVTMVSAFIGRSAPHFYYNLKQIPWSPHTAQIVATTKSPRDVEPLLDELRKFAHDYLPEAMFIPRKLEQGPPVDTPIEVRIFGEDFAKMGEVADQIMKTLREIPGAIDVRHNLSLGVPTLEYQILDDVAARNGLTRADVALALYGRTRGIPAGQYRAGDDPVPIIVRSKEGEYLSANDLSSIDVTPLRGKPVPLSQLTTQALAWKPASLMHHNGQRMLRVSSQLTEGTTYSQVQKILAPKVAAMQLPEGIKIAYGGQAQGSSDANSSMFATLPLGIFLLFAILLAEFNSFRRVAVVFVTVPLAAAGVVPGLLFGNQPFGFMSMLGVIALIGVVVNNAIVLIDLIESRRAEGADLREAISDAVVRRTRPILLTSATTIAGLLPLALTESTLWPPLAMAMISGLTASTLLTLVVVPALYLILFDGRLSRPSRKHKRVAPALALLLVFAFVNAQPLKAQDATTEPAPETTRAQAPADPNAPLKLSLLEAMRRAKSRPMAQAAHQRRDAAQFGLSATQRTANLPSLNAQYSETFRDRASGVDTPVGSFQFGDKHSRLLGMELRQSLFNPVARQYQIPAARQDFEAASNASELIELQAMGEAALVYLGIAGSDIQLKALKAHIISLESFEKSVAAMVEAGRALAIDHNKVALQLNAARQQRLQLENARRVALYQLGQAVDFQGAIEMDYPEQIPVPPYPPIDEALRLASLNRPDLKALAAKLKAQEFRAKAIGAEVLPKVDAVATWSWADGEPFRQDVYLDGAIQVRWNAFSGASRKPRARAMQAESKAQAAELEEAKRRVRLELQTALADIDTAKGAVTVAEEGVQLAEETLRVELERHLQGRATTNDVLEAEASQHQQISARELAKLNLLQAVIRLHLSTGVFPFL